MNMTEQKGSKTTTPTQPTRARSKLLSYGIKLVAAAIILGGAVWLFRYQIETSPRAPRQAPKPQAKLVQILAVGKSDCATVIEAMGTVVPAQQVTLQPQVSGKVVEMSETFIPGGYLQAGQNLLKIDPRDYEIVAEQRRASVASMQKDLKVEQGNQAIARQEYELLGEVVADEDRELVLRQPQLASAQAAVESAQAALQKAELDLARCTITAPFNAIIQNKLVDLGATVSTNSQLATLMGTDEAWIVLKVRIDQLQWIEIPEKNGQQGAQVKLYNQLAWGDGQFRTGHVVRVYGALEAEGKMAQLLVAVDDPFCLKADHLGKPKLLAGSFVQAEIEGRTLRSVIPIARTNLHDDDTVWIMDKDNTLQVRNVQVAYRGVDEVYVTDGLAEDEQLIVTDIAAPVPGMLLRLEGMETTDSPDNLQLVLDNEGDRQ